MSGALQPWLLAARPRTWPASLVPVLAGTAVAAVEGRARAGVAAAAFATALALQVGSNLANDVYDFERGADTEARRGPLRVTQAGLLSPRAVRAGMGVAFALAAASGLLLVARGGWPIAALGVLALLAAWAYTGGPLPLGYLGLGDPLVFVFFGLAAVAGSHYVQAGELSPLALAAALPLGLLATAILAVNNLRDRETDEAAGKRTLAVRLGDRASRRYYALLVLGAYAALPLLGWAGASPAAALLPLASLPLAWRLVRRVSRHAEDARLNATLADTARLLALHGALLVAGLLVGDLA
jgi:1,4-dihydroxy-2-naphthoate octaprenyltransferase